MDFMMSKQYQEDVLKQDLAFLFPKYQNYSKVIEFAAI
jgi:hypothetical protein